MFSTLFTSLVTVENYKNESIGRNCVKIAQNHLNDEDNEFKIITDEVSLQIADLFLKITNSTNEDLLIKEIDQLIDIIINCGKKIYLNSIIDENQSKCFLDIIQETRNIDIKMICLELISTLCLTDQQYRQIFEYQGLIQFIIEQSELFQEIWCSSIETLCIFLKSPVSQNVAIILEFGFKHIVLNILNDEENECLIDFIYAALSASFQLTSNQFELSINFLGLMVLNQTIMSNVILFSKIIWCFVQIYSSYPAKNDTLFSEDFMRNVFDFFKANYDEISLNKELWIIIKFFSLYFSNPYISTDFIINYFPIPYLFNLFNLEDPNLSILSYNMIEKIISKHKKVTKYLLQENLLECFMNSYFNGNFSIKRCIHSVIISILEFNDSFVEEMVLTSKILVYIVEELYSLEMEKDLLSILKSINNSLINLKNSIIDDIEQTGLLPLIQQIHDELPEAISNMCTLILSKLDVET